MAKSVAIVVCAWPPQGGGIGNNAYYHAIKLAERGYRVGVFTPDVSVLEKYSGAAEFFPLPTFWQLGKAGLMRGLLKKIKNYEIIHLYYPFFGSDLMVWLHKKLNPQTKLILHYEMDPVGEGIKLWVFWVYLKLFLGFLTRAADVIGVLSFDHAKYSYLAPYLRRRPDKFIELPNGIDAEIFKPRQRDSLLAETYRIKPQDKVIIFVGGLDSQHYFKGVPVLLEAFKLLPKNYFPNILDGEVRRGLLQEFRGEAKLLIVGDGNLREQFIQKAKELGVRDRVIFAGWIKNEDLSKYYSLADVFVLPSTARTESFGIVAAEAQACGLPAIVTDWPGLRETIIDSQTGFLIRPADVEDLLDKLKQLLNNDNLRDRFGRAGRAYVAGKYDWKIILGRLEEIYNKL